MKIYPITVGALQCNNYLIAEGDRAVLIDCSGDGVQILRLARELGVTLDAIILTHGHADHIEAVDSVAAEFSCPVYVHDEDFSFLKRADYNLSTMIYRMPLVVETDAIPFKDGEILRFGALSFEVIHTPGHTLGSVCLRCGDVLFTGDTLFRDSIGAIFPPFGDQQLELDSIRTRLYTIEEDMVCYPGHGEQTTLDHEKKNNEYCRL